MPHADSTCGIDPADSPAAQEGQAAGWFFQGRLRVSLRGHGEPVYAVTFSPDGKRLASAGEDRVVRLWDAEGKEVGRFEGHKEAVYAAAFSADGKRVATAGTDKVIRIWDVGAARP